MESFRQLASGQGDHGQTVLGDGRRVSKGHPLIRLLAQSDLLGVEIGEMRYCLGTYQDTNRTESPRKAIPLHQELAAFLRFLQEALIGVNGTISGAGGSDSESAAFLRKLLGDIDTFSETLAATVDLPDHFLIAGGSRVAIQANRLRTTCRECEGRLALARDALRTDTLSPGEREKVAHSGPENKDGELPEALPAVFNHLADTFYLILLWTEKYCS